MPARILAFIVLLITIAAAGYGGYRYWLHEEPRAMGPLARALIERFDPDQNQQPLDDVIDAHIDPQAPIAERMAVLEENGFDCALRPAQVAGNEILSCRRPIEGQRYCDRIHYYAYQTAAGEIAESVASTYRVSEQDRSFGRCPYEPPSAEAEVG